MGIGKARACDADICQSRDGSKTPIRSYYAEGEYVPGTPASQYYGIDQVGSVRRVFAGTTSASAYGYDPYGLPLQATAPITDYVYAGDATAAYALATWYLHGTHVKKDIAKGTELLRQAAAENVPSALYDLAVSHCAPRSGATGSRTMKSGDACSTASASGAAGLSRPSGSTGQGSWRVMSVPPIDPTKGAEGIVMWE